MRPHTAESLFSSRDLLTTSFCQPLRSVAYMSTRIETTLQTCSTFDSPLVLSDAADHATTAAKLLGAARTSLGRGCWKPLETILLRLCRSLTAAQRQRTLGTRQSEQSGTSLQCSISWYSLHGHHKTHINTRQWRSTGSSHCRQYDRSLSVIMPLSICADKNGTVDSRSSEIVPTYLHVRNFISRAGQM